MTRVYLGLGSNLRSPQRQLRLAITAIRQLPLTGLIKVARFYHNPAHGRKSQPRFSNTVVAIDTKLPPLRLLHLCHKIEKNQGRCRDLKWGARTLDIDILLYGQLIKKTFKLKIPHPLMKERDFVCIPLSEIAPQIPLFNEQVKGRCA